MPSPIGKILGWLRAKPSFPSEGAAAPTRSLCEAYCGERLRIVSLPNHSEATQRLREMGFCEAAEVRKIAEGGALLCQVCGVRVAIGRDLAEDIRVEPLRS